jgi:hypothetical protein
MLAALSSHAHIDNYQPWLLPSNLQILYYQFRYLSTHQSVGMNGVPDATDKSTQN